MKGAVMKIIRMNDMKGRELIPGGCAKFAHSEHMTFAYWIFSPGSIFPMHSHSHEQIMNVLQGTVEFTVGEEQGIYEAVTSIVIPPHVKHGGTTLTECIIVDVFHPHREDFAALDRKE